MRLNLSHCLVNVVLPVAPVVLLVIWYADLFVYQTSISSHDTINWYPQFAYFVESLASGHLPLWDPYSFSGAPFFLNLNGVGLLDPTVLIAVLLRAATDINTLDLYHYHYLVRLLIIYFGSYALFIYLKNDPFSATLSSGLMLLAFAPNAFWQNGTVVMFTYVPFIFCSLLKLIDSTSRTSARQHLMALVALVGISAHLYLPSYLGVFVLVLLIWFIATKQLDYKKVSILIELIGFKLLLLGGLILIVLVGPFLASVFYVVPELGEYFSFTRHELAHTDDVMIHQTPINIASVGSPARSSWHTLIGLIFPGVDGRFFMPSPLGITEQFVSLGIIPVVVTLASLWWCQNRFKGLLIFLLIVFGLLVFGPRELFQLLKAFPLVSGIRQVYNFLGYLLLFLFALFHISFAHILRARNTDQKRARVIGVTLAALFAVHLTGLVVYVRYLGARTDLISDEIVDLVRGQVVGETGLLILGYGLLLGLLLAKRGVARTTLAVGIAGYAIYGVYQFNRELKPFVVWPLHEIAAGGARQTSGFTYPEVRVPTIPRHSVYWGFLPSYYRVATAIPPYFNSYFSLTRRAYDYIRFPSFNRQTIMGGIGGQRYGIFSHYTVADHSEEALELVTSMSEESLREVVVLEKMPWKEQLREGVDGYVRKEDLSLESEPKLGRNQKVHEFYPQRTSVAYQEESGYRYGAKTADIPKEFPQLADWIGRSKFLGFYMILLGELEGSHYNLMSYFPDPSIRFLDEGKGFCYLYVANYFVRHVTPGFHGEIYDEYPHECDIWKSGEALAFSPEIQGWHISADVPVGDKNINGATLAFLDESTGSMSSPGLSDGNLIEVDTFGPNHITFAIKNDKPGIFYYADSYTKDWNVKVDGIVTDLLAANFNSKAVPLEAGTHRVEFFYRPKFYFWAFWAYLVLGVPIVLLVIGYNGFQFARGGVAGKSKTLKGEVPKAGRI